MRTIIAGSRTITSYSKVVHAIQKSGYKITEVFNGGSKGVDFQGKRWAIHNDIPVRNFPANWTKYGKAAGPIRNAEMAAEAEALILIWDGKSRGSANMLKCALEQGLEIYETKLKEAMKC